MKKNWINPELDSLEITKTAGGPVLNDTKDGDVWWNEGEGRWEQPIGEHEDLSP